jgi:hypothetical protein
MSLAVNDFTRAGDSNIEGARLLQFTSYQVKVRHLKENLSIFKSQHAVGFEVESHRVMWPCPRVFV